MCKINFSSKALSYEQNALVQKSASEILLNLMAIQKDEDVLDLGCGSGGVTRKIAFLTRGTVVGTDISKGMISEAICANSDLPNVSFFVKDAQDLEFTGRFEISPVRISLMHEGRGAVMELGFPSCRYKRINR